jgi:hypothetical protein
MHMSELKREIGELVGDALYEGATNDQEVMVYVTDRLQGKYPCNESSLVAKEVKRLLAEMAEVMSTEN